MQTALFIRQHPPLMARPPLPFGAELRAAVEEEMEETPAPTPTPTPAPAADRDTTTQDTSQDTSQDTPSSPPSPSQPRITFANLPAEIRSAIWTESLPRRVIPLVADDAATETVPPGARAGVGSRMPQAMAGACYESRAAAMHSGRWTIGAEGQPVWYDPKRDTILLNSRQAVDYSLLRRATRRDGSRTPPRPTTPTDPHGERREDDNYDDEVSSWRLPVPVPAPPLAPVAVAQTDMETETPSPLNPTSTVSMADLAQHRLNGCLAEAARSGGSIAVEHDLLYSHAGRAIFPLLKRFAKAAAERKGSPPPQLLVYFDEIVLSGTRDQAVASGLFGGAASPEEHMFFVPLSDRATLQRIHALSKMRPYRESIRAAMAPAGARAPAGAVDPTGSEGRAHLQGRLGGLRIGSAGFLRQLLRPSQTIQNLRVLSMRYLYHRGQWRADHNDEPSDLLIARAMEAGMPPLEQAILFRFKEEPE